MLRRAVSNYLIAVVMLLVVTEFLIRDFVTTPVATIPDNQLGWIYRPYSEVLFTKEGYARNRMNAQGFNDDDFVADPTRASTLILGDSFTEALQVPRQDNFTSYLEQLSPCINTFNAGRSGLSPLDYPVVYKRLRAIVHPQHVVMVLNHSDLSELRQASPAIERNTDNSIRSVTVTPPTLNSLRVMLEPLLRESALATYGMYRLKELQQAPPTQRMANTDGDTQDLGRFDELLLYALNAIALDRRLYVLYVPVVEYSAKGSAVELIESKRLSEHFATMALRVGVPFASAFSELAAAYQDTGQPPVGFQNSDIRSGHLNANGHAAVAHTLQRLLHLQCDPATPGFVQ